MIIIENNGQVSQKHWNYLFNNFAFTNLVSSEQAGQRLKMTIKQNNFDTTGQKKTAFSSLTDCELEYVRHMEM